MFLNLNHAKLLICIAAASILTSSTGRAAQLEWIGGTDDLWHSPTNWAPIDVPGEDPIQRAPQEGDDVVILDASHGTNVRLDADTAPLASLMLGNGFELNTNSHVLNVAGQTTLAGNGTSLGVAVRPWEFRNLPAFDTRQLQIGEGATVQLQDSVLQIKEHAWIESGGDLGGFGDFIIGQEHTPEGTVVLVNDGTLGAVRTDLPFRAGSAWFNVLGGAMLDIDGETEQGVIDLDRTERVYLSIDGALADPYNGPLSLRAGDAFSAYSADDPFIFEDATIHIDGGPDYFMAAHLGFNNLIVGGSTLTIEPGVAVIDGRFRMTGGTFRSSANLTVQTTDSPSSDGLWEKEIGPDAKFFLEDGSALYLPSFNNTVNLQIDSNEVDLDGDNGDVRIFVGLWSSLHIAAPAVDNDPSSPGFDGTIHLDGSDLTMNFPGGWELDGRLELGTNSQRGSAQVFGTSITVDGGEPNDGIYVAARDYDNSEEITIHIDVAFTPKGFVAIDEEIGYLKITGSLQANGTLQYVKLFDDYEPTVGTAYSLIHAQGGITGRFATLDFFPLLEGRAWLVEYTNASVNAKVVDAIDGEFNGNGLVEQGDLDLILLNWGESATPPPAGWINDLPEGMIDQAELDRVLLGWGTQAQQARSRGVGGVPEPAGWIILLLVCSVIVKRMLPQQLGSAMRPQ